MSVGKVIYDKLSSDGPVSGLVSTRIYPDTVPQEATFPYIAYTVISTSPTDEKDGASQLDEVQVQIDIYSRAYGTTQDIATAARTALDRFSGTNNSVVVDKIIFQNEASGQYEPMIGVYWITQDYRVRVKR